MQVKNSFTANFRALIFGLLILIFTLFGGAVGYVSIEGYSWLDGFYMTVITMSTVGYREVQPLSDGGKIFTILLLIFSFGVFGYVLTQVTKLIIEGVLRQSYREYKLRKKLIKLTNHTIVCGYGRNGFQACQELASQGERFVIVEKRDNVVTRILEEPDLLFVQGDAASEEVLELAQIRHAKALITALPNDADNIFVVLTAREMNPSLKIISRASEFKSDVKLRHAGATNVIMPDRIGGQRMAKLVMQPDVVEFMEYILLQDSKDVQLVEVKCNELLNPNSRIAIKKLNIKELTGSNLIGIKTEEGTYIFNPSEDIEITWADKLFVLGTHTQIITLKKRIGQEI